MASPWLIGIVSQLVLISLAASQVDLVVVANQGSIQHLQLISSMQLAVAVYPSPLAVVPFFTANNSFTTVLLLQSYMESNISTTSAVFLLDGLDGDETISALLATFQVPVLRYATTSHDTPTTATNAIESAVFHRVCLDLMASFSWTVTNLVYDALFTPNAQDFISQASLFNITVKGQFRYNSEDLNQDIVYALDSSSTRAVVAMLDPLSLQQLIIALEDTAIQVIWIDPTFVTPSYQLVNLASLNTQLNPIRGFFTVSPVYNSSGAQELFAKLNSSQQSLFQSPQPMPSLPNLAAVFDLTLMWCGALDQVVANSDDPSNSSLVAEAFYNLNTLPPGLISSVQTYQSGSGHKVGPLQIINFQLISGDPEWVNVGSWTGPLSTDANSRSTLSINTTAIRFAGGTNVIPSVILPPTIKLAHLAEFSSQTGQYWAEVTQLAVLRINADPTIIPGYNLKMYLQDDGGTQTGIITSSEKAFKRGVIGFIGPTTTPLAQALQLYIGGQKIPNVAFSATGDALIDKSLYPTFFRTIDPDSVHGKLFSAFVAHYNWSKACVVLESTNVFDNLTSNTVIQVGDKKFTLHTVNVKLAGTDFSAGLDDIENFKCTAIVVVGRYPNPTARLFPQALARGLMGPNMTWVWTSGVGAASVFKNDSAYVGSFYTSPVNSPSDSELAQFKSDMALRTPLPFGSFSTYLYDAVWLAARAFGATVKSGQNPLTNLTAVLTSMKQVSFNGLTGSVSVDAVGNRINGQYGLYNLQPGGPNNTLRSVLVGVWINNELHMIADPVWSDGTYTPPRDPDLPILLVDIQSGPAALAAFAAFGLAMMVITFIVVLVFQRNKLIRRSSPFFLQIILLGLTFALVSVFFWLGEPTPVSCHLRVWFGFAGVSTAYSALLAKNARLYWLFSRPTLRIVAIPNKQLVTYLLLCLSPLCIALTLWSSLDPFQIVSQITSSGNERYLICKSSNDLLFASICFSYVGVLFVIGSVLSYRTRTLPDVFRESWFLALATYNMLLLSALCIILGYVLAYDVLVTTLVICAGLIIGSLVTQSLVFLPKFHAMVSQRTKIDNMDSSSKFPTSTDTKCSLDLSTFTSTPSLVEQ